jgi:hypothetical protein
MVWFLWYDSMRKRRENRQGVVDFTISGKWLERLVEIHQ